MLYNVLRVSAFLRTLFDMAFLERADRSDLSTLGHHIRFYITLRLFNIFYYFLNFLLFALRRAVLFRSGLRTGLYTQSFKKSSHVLNLTYQISSRLDIFIDKRGNSF